MTIARTFLVVLTAALAALLLAGPASAKVQTGAVERELGPGTTALKQSETGHLRFVGTAPGKPIAAPVGGSRSDVALAFAGSLGSELGVVADELTVSRVDRLDDGHSAVRLQQLYEGVPVIGGEFIVNLDDNRDVLSLSGEASPSPSLETDPAISADEADDIALAAFAKESGISPDDVQASEPELSILDSRIMGGPGLDRPVLVWRTELTPADPDSVEPIREFVAVDAQLGSVALTFSQIADAKSRVVCDAGNTTSKVPCTAPFARTEASGPSGITEVNNAFVYAGDTYDLFFSRFGRDSLDGAGMQLISTTRYCASGQPCPYANAFWNGQQMVYGDGFAAADDVVGHELAHGFTDFSSHLFYYYQSGAINESMSDVFGEFVDLTNGAGTDTPGVRWLLGEDVPVFGAIRDMKTPGTFGDPDRMQSPNYSGSSSDHGGVHTNSGVNNKATYLMTDGDTFNGQAVSGLGIDKVARIYYQVNNNLLTSASDYQDLAAALRQACSNLVGTAGITTANCAEVNKVVLATQMDQVPASAPTATAATCTTAGEAPENVFFDNLENPATGNWASAPVSGGSNEFYYPQNSNPYGFDATYATSGTTNIWGWDQAFTTNQAIGMTKDVTVPAEGLMHFNHVYGFESGFDGGAVEYSTNAGASWTDAGSLFEANGYNDPTVSALPGGGFTGFSNGYGSSRLDLSSLAGQNVRFRFHMATDGSANREWGWFIDDVRIYVCEVPDTTPPETQITSGPADGSSQASDSAAFGFSSPDDPTASFQCSVDGGGFGPCSGAATHSLSGLSDGNHSFAVRGVDPKGNIDATPAGRSFKVTAEACVKAKKKAKKATKRYKKAKKAAKKASGKKAKKLKKKAKKLKKKAKKAKQAQKKVC